MDTERAQLPKIELFASFFIYVGTVLFALYKAIEFGNGECKMKAKHSKLVRSRCAIVL